MKDLHPPKNPQEDTHTHHARAAPPPASYQAALLVLLSLYLSAGATLDWMCFFSQALRSVTLQPSLIVAGTQPGPSGAELVTTPLGPSAVLMKIF